MTALTPEQEGRIREIVAEMIGQFAAGSSERIAAATEATARTVAEIAATARAGFRHEEMSVTELAISYREAAAEVARAHHRPLAGDQHRPSANASSPPVDARGCPASAQGGDHHE